MNHPSRLIPGQTTGSRVVFGVSAGRSGGRWLCELLEGEGRLGVSLERDPLNETFRKYCLWYGLSVDGEGFLTVKEREVREALERHSAYFEMSPYLALSIWELYERFGAAFICLVRHPERVVRSLLAKGWYESPDIRKSSLRAPSYGGNLAFHSFLGRIVPTGEERKRWEALSRVGKIAWYWNTINARICEQLNALPASHRCIYKLEGLSSREHYADLCRFLGFETRLLSDKDYEKKYYQRPESFSHWRHYVKPWTPEEWFEFEAEVRPMASVLGYELCRKAGALEGIKRHAKADWGSRLYDAGRFIKTRLFGCR